MKRFSSLQGRLPLLIVCINAIPLIIFALFGYAQARNYFERQKLGDMMNIIDTKYIHVLDLLDKGKADVRAVAGNPIVFENLRKYYVNRKSDALKETSQLLKTTVETTKMTKKHPFNRAISTRQRYRSLLVVDDNNVIVAANEQNIVGSSANGYHYKKGTAAVMDVARDPDGNAVFGFSAPIFVDENGQKRQLGTLIATVDAGLLEMIMTGEIGNITGGSLFFAGFSKSLDLYIMNKDGYMITQSRTTGEDTVLKKKGSRPPLDRALDVNASGTRVTNAGIETGAREVMETYDNYRNDQVAGASMVVFDQLWTVVIEEKVSEAFAPIYRLKTIFSSALAIIILFGGLVGIIISRRITGPLAQVVESADKIAQGNLDERVHVNRKDEIGALAAAFNQMTGNLKKMIESEAAAKATLESIVAGYKTFVERVAAGDLSARLSLNGHKDELSQLGHNLNRMVESLHEMAVNMKQATNDIASASTEIFAATAQHNSGAAQQAASINQTSVTVDEVRQTAEQTSDRAQSVASSALKSAEISENGTSAVEETISGMEQIKEKVEQIAANTLALSEQTQQIGDIIATVNDIAEQSNLLALNASIEAARAGEQGKGFAVVAAEVRNLAEQSQQATSQVKAILDDIQKATNTVVMVTEEGTKGVDSGMLLANQAGETIRTLATAISESAEAAQQIVVSAQQQAAGMDQIATAMSNINQSTSQALASTKQTEKAVEHLSELGTSLKEKIAVYRLTD